MEMTLGSVLFSLFALCVLAAVVVQTVQGYLRWLWFNRHGLLRVVWRLAIFSLLVTVISAVCMFLMGITLHLLGLAEGNVEIGEGSGPADILAYAFLILAMFAASVVPVMLLDRRKLGSLGLAFHSRWFRQLCHGLLAGIVFISAIVAVQAAVGTLRLAPAGVDGIVLLRGFLMNLLVMVGVGFFEELMFRGYLLQVLAEGIGDFCNYLRETGRAAFSTAGSAERTGMIVSAVLLSVPFGFVHYFNQGGTLTGAFSTGAAGLVLALAYFRTRSLWVPVGLHITWNFTMGWVYSLPVSGTHLEPLPFVPSVTGPEWLSGGTFGPEGSVLAFAGMALMAVWFYRSRMMDAAPDSLAAYPPPSGRLKKKGPAPA
jgi:membrane protease YdiL (CAAX protease family)